MTAAKPKASAPARARLPEANLPFIPPCLATLTQAPPDGAQWVHEVKFDGYRMQAHVIGKSVRLISRNGLDWTSRFAHIARGLSGIKAKTAILDGEIVVEDQSGRSSFVELVSDLKRGQSSRMLYYAFDLLHLNGKDLRALPLEQRKSNLAELIARLPSGSAIRLSKHIAGHGAAMLKEACALGLEGIVSKRSDRPYRSGRGVDWLKSKCLVTDEFVVAGFVPSTAMKDAVGALLLGYYEGTALRYAGRVGTGFSQTGAHALYDLLQPLERRTAAFASALTAAQRRGAIWVEPRLVAQIEYRAVTSARLLRHASFKGLRDDKPAKSVTWPLAAIET